MAKKKIEKNIVTLERLITETVPIDSLTPNTYNPNRQSDREFELLCRSIEEDGFTQPVLVNRATREIIDGEHRWRACKVLGWTEITVVFTDMTREQQMISTLRHNRARGSEDISKASDVLRNLQHMGVLDHVADSLMLDDVEMKVMLDDIPSAELHLRNPGDKLTVDQVTEQIRQERALERQRYDQDKSEMLKEKKNITMLFKVHGYEYRQITQVTEILAGKDTAKGIYLLCKMYQNNQEALNYAAQKDDQPLYSEQLLDSVKE